MRSEDEGGRRDGESWAPDWRQGTGTLHHAQPDPRRSCALHPGQPSGEACPVCNPPRRRPDPGPAAADAPRAVPGRPGTGARPADDTAAEADAPTPTPPRWDESCPLHPGSRRDAAGGECRGCRADRLAATPSPTERPRYVPRNHVELVRAWWEGDRRRIDRHGGRACACAECAELRVKVWAECACCGAAMHPWEQERGRGLCRRCAAVLADLQAGSVPPVAPAAPEHHVRAARAAIQEARTAIHRARSEAIERAERRRRS